ncbi:MAG: epoxyqueuosine reductase, partial [Chloroflexi bacterium]|nr:epoxyqueuosine reductase [Chloroflexota bacterium]
RSPVKRAKRVGLQRNVCVALGNIGDPTAVPALAAALEHDSEIVREHAAWALGRIGGDKAIHALHAALDSETDNGVISELRLAIEEIEAS